MAALKVTTMATSCISTKHHPPQWVRRIPPALPTTGKARTQIVVAMTSKSSVVINRGGGVRGERMSVWWRDGWRLISCADFGWGTSHQKITNLAPPPSSSTFSSSSSTSTNNKNSKMEEERERDDDIKPPKLLTIPTILTLGRVAAIPLLVTTFYSNSLWATTVTTSIFIAAAITDWLDGYLARRMHLGTPFGAFLDPVADKLMVAATLVLLCTRPLEVGAFGEIPWLLPIPSIAIIGREITMSAVREWAASQNGKVLEAVAVNNLGKWKTAAQMTALTILLATRDTSRSRMFTRAIKEFSASSARKRYSDVFVLDGYQWRLLIFPKGNNVDKLSIYLVVADSPELPDGWNRYAEFGLSVLNQVNSQLPCEKIHITRSTLERVIGVYLIHAFE